MHLAWCGPCDVMEQNYRSIYFNLPEADKRIEFWTACEEIIPEDIQAKLNHGKISCKPRFALFLEGEKVDEIDGVDFTRLEAAINKHVPMMDE